jgi:hypothetical protein
MFSSSPAPPCMVNASSLRAMSMLDVTGSTGQYANVAGLEHRASHLIAVSSKCSSLLLMTSSTIYPPLLGCRVLCALYQSAAFIVWSLLTTRQPCPNTDRFAVTNERKLSTAATEAHRSALSRSHQVCCKSHETTLGSTGSAGRSPPCVSSHLYKAECSLVRTSVSCQYA